MAMWLGPVACRQGAQVLQSARRGIAQARRKGNMRMWYGQLRGTDLGTLGGTDAVRGGARAGALLGVLRSGLGLEERQRRQLPAVLQGQRRKGRADDGLR